MTRNAPDQPFDRTLYDLEPFVPLARSQAAWVVSVGGVKLTMLGEKCRHSEALANARVIWAGAEIV
jgi:hypothetical protein